MMMKRTLAPLAFGLAVALASPALLADSAKSDSYLAEARKSLQKGDLKTAIIQLKNAVQSNPANLAARYDLGVAQLRAGDLLSAEKELKTVKDKNWTGKDVSVPLAELYLRQRKFDAIIGEILPGDRAAADESVVRLARGYALFALQRRDEAEKSLLESLERAENPARAQTALARVKAASGDTQAALDYAKKATESDPKSTEAWQMLAQIHSVRGEVEPARAAFTRAVELSPNDLNVRIVRAQFLVANKEFQLAQSDINVALKANPKNPSANYLDALVQARQQNWRGAEAALQKMGAALANFAPGIFLEASVKLAQGSIAQAEESINRYLALRPADPTGSMFLANLLVRRNALPRAVDVLKQSAEKHPQDVRVLAHLSDTYIRNKQPEQADAVLDQLSELSPSDATLRTQLAAQRLRLGQADEAIADLEAATELNPNATSAGMLLVLTNLQANKLDEAQAAAEALRERQPTNPVTENLLGLITLRKQDLSGARRHFEAALKLKEDFAPALMNIAQLEKLENRPEKAREIYHGIIARQANNEGALTALADLSIGEKKNDDAIQWLEKARSGNPRSVTPRLRLVDLYLAKRETSKAVAIARETAQLAPQQSRTQTALGVALLANGEVESALQALRRAVDLDPGSAATQFHLARAYIGQKDFKTARGWLEKALQANLADLEMQQRFLEFSVAAQDVDAAVEFARRISTQRPSDPAAELLLGGALEISGKPGEALGIYERALSRSENVVFVTRLASLHTRTNQPEKAVSALQDWLAKHPDDDRVRFQLASLYITMQKYDDALREHESLLKRAPQSAVILNNLAWLYDHKKDERALATAERAYSINSAATIGDTLAWILIGRGEHMRALPILEKAVAEAPNSSTLRYHYGVALEKAGKRGDARREVEAALRNEASLGNEVDAAKRFLKDLGG